MRRLFHCFFALAVLLGGIGAEPPAAAHEACCCVEETACPCAPPQSPRSPRPPCCDTTQVQAALPASTKLQASRQAQQRTEPRPWNGMYLATLGRAECEPIGVPRDLPRPPDRSLDRQSRLQTFRI